MVERLDETLRNLEINYQNDKKSSKTFKRSQLSLDINDILSLDLDESPLESKHPSKSVSPKKTKCCPAFLGGADLFPGCSHAVDFRKHFTVSNEINYKTCSALQCRNCDFSVSFFPNYEWTEDVEYLFLRTYMPNFEKISEKLRRKNGTVAYACHCISFSTEKLQLLHDQDLPWFCKGHA